MASWTTERGLLPNIVKQRSSETQPFFVITSPEGVVEELTFADLDNASNRAAWFLTQHLGEDEQKFFYMGRMDIRYCVWVLAAMKAGKCAVVPSPSNTVIANQLLFQDVGAKAMLFTSEGFEILESLHDATKDSLRWIETPKYEDLVSKEKVEDFPFNHTFDEIKDVPFAALHTSGTTGHPKPIYWSHVAVAIHGTQMDPEIVPTDKELVMLQMFKGTRAFTHFPWYHAGGMICFISSIIGGTKSVISPAPGTRLTAENVCSIFKINKPDAAMVAPTIAENMLKYEPGLEELAKLKQVMFGGGPMNPTAGAKLAKVLPHLAAFIGSTESGLYLVESYTGSEHWNAFKFLDMGQRMEEVEPGLYELVFPRSDFIMKILLIFHSYPQLNEYRTKDLFAKVEGHPGWWTYRGRADNWIAMSNGLKFDPKNVEDAISAHPDVSSVMLAGERRFRLCLLIELEENCYPEQGFGSAEEEEAWREQMLEKLWPTIDAANHTAPKFGRVPKELVLFTKKDKPFSRSPKGSIQRRLTLGYYQQAIDDLYTQSEQGLLTHGLPPLNSTSAEDLLPFIRELYAQTLEYEGFGDDEDAFSRGMDSFAVATLSSRLKAALRAYGTPEVKLGQIGIKLLYTATTPRLLANKLSAILSDTEAEAGPGDNSEAVEMVEKYEAEVQKVVEQSTRQLNGDAGNAEAGASGHVIAVTGTTGSLGTYLLATLLARPDVSKVICINRAADAREKQPKALQSRGLPPLQPALEQGRVEFMTMDVAKPKLGLTEEQHATLVREVTSIIHNAFPVNFLMTVKQFEPQYVGMLSLLEIAALGKRHPSFLFISSIGASVRRTTQLNPVPEAMFEREEARDLMMAGYGSAKFICERMTHQFTVASVKAGRPVAAAVIRVGQVSGPLAGEGSWNVWEWLPSIVVSSKFLGVAPATIGQLVDWIPVDELAKITSDLMDTVEKERSNTEKTPVFNVVNPKTGSWDELLPAVKTVAPETLPVLEWIERLEKTRESSTHILDQNPGVKLAEFYKGFLTVEGGLHFSTDELVRASPTAAKLRPIEQQDMLRWIKSWGL